MSPETIAVFLPNWIGDAIMATPAIRHLHETFPRARLVAVSRAYVAPIMHGSPWFSSMVLHDKTGKEGLRGAGVIRELRKLDIDVAILFPNSFRSAMMAWFGKCDRRIGFARYARGCLLTDPLEPRRNPKGKIAPSPIVDEYNRLASRLTGDTPEYRMELFTEPEDDRAASRVWTGLGLSSRPVIGLNPGGAFGASKHWPTGHFADLANRLIDAHDADILVLCGPKEREIAREIQQKAGRDEVKTLADADLSLGLLKGLIRRMNLLVTTDSGPRHIGAAFGLPVVSLFGPTHIEWTNTYYPREVHLSKKVPCGPCQLRACPLAAPRTHQCMNDLMPATVAAAVERLLAEFPLKTRGMRYAG